MSRPATPLRREQADHPRVDGVSGSGRSRRGRAENACRPGQDGHRAQPSCSGRSDVPVSTDHETGQTIIAGMGELHLEIIVDRMKREFGVEANVGKPQVAYRETITQAGRGQGKLHEAVGWPRPVRPRRARDRAGTGRRVSSSRTRSPAARSRGSLSSRSRRAFVERCDAASLAGYELVDIRSTLLRRFSTTRSTRRKWRSRLPVRWRSRTRQEGQAGSARADHEGRGGNAREYMGSMSSGDLNSRRGQIEKMEPRPARRSSPRSCRCPRCSVTRPTFARRHRAARPRRCTSQRYDEAPKTVAEEIIAKVKGIAR